MTHNVTDYGILRCRHCDIAFRAASANAKYCGMGCQQAAYRARRSARRATGEAGVPHFDADPHQIKQLPSVAVLDAQLREVEARNAGKPILASDAPTELQSVLDDLGFGTSKKKDEEK